MTLLLLLLLPLQTLNSVNTAPLLPFNTPHVQSSDPLRVQVEFEGGLELLFARVKKYALALPTVAVGVVPPALPTPAAEPRVLAPVAACASEGGDGSGCCGSGGCGASAGVGVGAGAGAGAAAVPARGPVGPREVAGPAIESPTSLRTLILWLRDNLLQERSELFVVGTNLCVGSCRALQRAMFVGWAGLGWWCAAWGVRVPSPLVLWDVCSVRPGWTL